MKYVLNAWFCCLAAAGCLAAEPVTLWPGDGVTAKATEGGTVRVEDGAILVRTKVGPRWPGVGLVLPADVDATAYGELVAVVSNRLGRASSVTVHVKDRTENNAFLSGEAEIPAHGEMEVVVPVALKTFPTPKDFVLPGLRDYEGERTPARGFDPRRVARVSVFHRRDGAEASFTVRRILLRGAGGVRTALGTKAFLPFVDRYGQLAHADWPGKFHADADFAAARVREEAWLDAHAASPIAGADRFGGWATGPQLEATGQFRVQKVDGKWWFVDPDGHLFFSQGVAGVRVTGQTGVTRREGFFSWLPSKDDPLFGPCWGRGRHPAPRSFYSDRAHVPFDTFSFAHANMRRKYGADWKPSFAETAQRRLRAWGINTIANWSDGDVYRLRRTPYTSTLSPSGRSIRGKDARGAWGPFLDVFEPDFEKNVKAAVDAEAARSGRDPWCIGWFVGNELSWGTDARALARATLQSPADQPAKRTLLQDLRGKYGDIARLNAAWRADYADWEDVRTRTAVPDETVPAVAADLAAFHRRIAERYFSCVRDAIKAAAPNRLYLGCRFAWGDASVWRVAAAYCDVVSVNTYKFTPAAKVLPEGAVDKPLLVGEFHFGALDRGMLHTGLVPVADQRARAEAYKAYVRAALDDPRFAGVHWFIWRDQPLTGRPDGECFQIGFVSVVDEPYPEMVDAARELAAELYPRRGRAAARP